MLFRLAKANPQSVAKASMGNPIAYLALILWPVVSLWLFRKLPFERALIWTILGAYLFLPQLTEFNLPLVPDMDKVTIPNLSALLLVLLIAQKKLRILPESRIARWLIGGVVLCAIPSVLTNMEPIIFEVLGSTGPVTFLTGILPGQSIRDIGSTVINQILILIPFVLARQFLSSETGMRELCIAFMVGALIYTIPSLIEIRLSPQMHVWIYGFFQHSFEQTIREGGFRPIVFLPHGLWLALYMLFGLLCATAVARVTPAADRWKSYMAVGYLFLVLVMCKSLASFAYAVVLVPVVFLAPARWQIRIAVVFGIVAVGYPMLRNLELIPTDWILQQANAYNPNRGASLAYRFFNEGVLLERAAEKPFFGWGGWGRNLVRHAETGEILSIPDGQWIVVFGTFGWLGYICEFGILAFPLFLTWRATRNMENVPPFIAPLCIILGINLMDMLLNATVTPLTWLTAGAILGYAEQTASKKALTEKVAIARSVLGGTGARPLGKRTVL
jgi:hypothetical protein